MGDLELCARALTGERGQGLAKPACWPAFELSTLNFQLLPITSGILGSNKKPGLLTGFLRAA